MPLFSVGLWPGNWLHEVEGVLLTTSSTVSLLPIFIQHYYRNKDTVEECCSKNIHIRHCYCNKKVGGSWCNSVEFSVCLLLGAGSDSCTLYVEECIRLDSTSIRISSNSTTSRCAEQGCLLINLCPLVREIKVRFCTLCGCIFQSGPIIAVKTTFLVANSITH